MRVPANDMPISGILAALYFLSQEAERGGRDDVKAVLRSTIVAIDSLGKGAGGTTDLTNSATCAVLAFFDAFVKASPAARADFLELMREDGTGT